MLRLRLRFVEMIMFNGVVIFMYGRFGIYCFGCFDRMFIYINWNVYIVVSLYFIEIYI